MTVQLNRIKMPAAVVIYSNNFPGNSSAATTAAMRPHIAKLNEASGKSFYFNRFANTLGALLSLAKLASKVFTPNKEAVIAEKPATIIAAFNT